eukprot:g16529.t1
MSTHRSTHGRWLQRRLHARRVLSLHAAKRIFFSATLRTAPDFDFGLRPAIRAKVIKDYTVMVPVLTEGDPRPGLVELIQNTPLARKILAFCNTVHEAKNFTHMLSKAGIAASHYNAHTGASQRQGILESFERSEAHGGIRVLVTVDVLSEGVDLPAADTCMFVAPRSGIRLQQCVGRVLRNHPDKVDALVIAPPIVQCANSTLVEDAELSRLLGDLAAVDPVFEESLRRNGRTADGRVGISAQALQSAQVQGVVEAAAEMLRVHVFRKVLGGDEWERGFQELVAFRDSFGDLLVKTRYKTASGYPLGKWVCKQRQAMAKGKLDEKKVKRLEGLGFIWKVRDDQWESAFQRLVVYKSENGDVAVPYRFRTEDRSKLGVWVFSQRQAMAKGRLHEEKVKRLEGLDFIWNVHDDQWESAFQRLVVYKSENGDVVVPQHFTTKDLFKLGVWVFSQRRALAKGKLNEEKVKRLEGLGFIWKVRDNQWESAFQRLVVYKSENGDVVVPFRFTTKDRFKLGRWADAQRQAMAKGRLDEEKVKRLEGLGFG